MREGERIDLLVTDVGLPGGLSGRQLAAAGRQIHAELPILFVTGYAETAALREGERESGVDVMTKPFRVDDLLRRIDGLLEGRLGR